MRRAEARHFVASPSQFPFHTAQAARSLHQVADPGGRIPEAATSRGFPPDHPLLLSGRFLGKEPTVQVPQRAGAFSGRLISRPPHPADSRPTGVHAQPLGLEGGNAVAAVAGARFVPTGNRAPEALPGASARQLELAGCRAAGAKGAVATLVGLSDKCFREHLLPHCPKFYVGRRVLIPRRAFERFIEQLGDDEFKRQEATAADILDRVRK